MLEMGFAARVEQARYRAFRWRAHLAFAEMLGLAAVMAAITGLLAQVRVYLPWTAVPITGQTFAVLLAGVLLGGRWGSVSQAIYIALGVAGVPWFSGWQSGYAALVGPTGGYMLGFLLAAFLVGTITDEHVRARGFLPLLGVMLLGNLVIYAAGLLQLNVWLRATQQAAPSLGALLWMGAIPFIGGDLLKIAAAAAFARGVTPRQAFDR